MIRYYEAIGLIRRPLRTGSGYRVYDAEDIRTLRFIKRARTLGFTIDETARLLARWRDQAPSDAEVRSFALRHVRDLEARISQLRAAARTIRGLASGSDGPGCPILDYLGQAGEVGAADRGEERWHSRRAVSGDTSRREHIGNRRALPHVARMNGG